jgi:predicted Zn-dependent protease with MMP-like domain
MNQKEFDALVRQVLDELPPELHRHIGMVLPDKISIYRQPILRSCRDDVEARKTIGWRSWGDIEM